MQFVGGNMCRKAYYQQRYKDSTTFETATTVYRPNTAANSYVSFAQQQRHQQYQLKPSASATSILSARSAAAAASPPPQSSNSSNNIVVTPDNNRPLSLARSHTQPIYCYKLKLNLQQKGETEEQYQQRLQQLQHHQYRSAGLTTTTAASTNDTKPPAPRNLQHLHNNSSSIVAGDTSSTYYNDQRSSPQFSSIGHNDSHEQRIFEMSGIDTHHQQQQQPDDSPMSSARTDADECVVQETEASSNGVTIVRTNSVRARANMFQQLTQQRSRDPEQKQRISPKRITRRNSPPPPISTSLSMSINDEPRTPNNPPVDPDEEIEPSSLPLAERLRFFSNLSARNNQTFSTSMMRSPTSSLSLSADRSSFVGSSMYSSYYSGSVTPRSCRTSIASCSSASVTPTPMDCTPGNHSTTSSPPIVINQNGMGSTPSPTGQHHHHQNDDDAMSMSPKSAFDYVQLSKSASQKLSVPHQEDQSIDAGLTPMAKRIKLKTIGKLMLPSTFLANDRNNNKMDTATTPPPPLTNGHLTETDKAMPPELPQQPPPAAPVKKIGKIKSPFIESCNQLQPQSQLIRQPFKHNKQENEVSFSYDHELNGGVRKCQSNSSLSSSNQLKQCTSSQTIIAYRQSCVLHDGDAGKENCELIEPQPPASSAASSIVTTAQTVSEVRKRFVRSISNATQAPNAATTTTAARNAYNTSQSADLQRSRSANRVGVDTKFAKYFGIDITAATNATTNNSSTTTANNKAPQRGSTGILYSNIKLPPMPARLPSQQESPQKQTPSSSLSSPKVESPCEKTNKSLRHIDELMRSMEATTTKFNAANKANQKAVAAERQSPIPIDAVETSESRTTVICGTPRRRDALKRQRALTSTVNLQHSKLSTLDGDDSNSDDQLLTIVSGSATSRTSISTLTSSSLVSSASKVTISSASGSRSARSLRGRRAVTLNSGIGRQPEVKSFEDIVITKEEFQAASVEFERLFQGLL